MKVGYTRLAGRAFAFAQAFFKTFFITLNLMAPSQSLLAADTPITVPFIFVGNTIFVEASINGQSGTFLFDTGASDLILNSKYFSGKEEHSEIVGLYGEVLTVQHLVAQQIEMAGFNIAKDIALVLDLGALEQIKKLPIAGIIGYSILKDFELQFDFKNQEILLFKLKRNGTGGPVAPYATANAFDFKMSGHIPYLEMRVGDKLVRMGIDSGSERNILQPEMLDTQAFESAGTLRLAGISPTGKRQEKGYIHDVNLSGLPLDKLEVVLTDMDAVSSELPIELHGILGVQFMKDYKVAINYQLRKIYLWQPKENDCLTDRTEL